jgi:hypothetical protein
MTDAIHDPTEDFDFDQVTLTPPMAIAGGNHYMKYLLNGKPLYMQTPVCKSKGGLHLDMSGNKRPFCDLMFTNDNEAWIQWVENLERHTCKYMFERKEKWFASDLDMTDIENYFQSPLKIYKSGKFYLARTAIPVRLGKIMLKIYDDTEREIDPSTITDETDVMTIIQVQGIKCSARSFQVELELKQMLVVSPTDVFEKCLLLGRGATAATEAVATEAVATEAVATEAVATEAVATNAVAKEVTTAVVTTAVAKEEEEEAVTPPRPAEDLLLAVDVSLDESGEAVEIKPRNEVFYEIYREARRKAKEARAAALAAYLEARNIKTTYNLASDDEEDEKV